MNKFKKELQNILENDPLKLLNTKSRKSTVISSEKRLIDSFEEINSFFEKEGREPKETSDILERQLYSRLQGIRANFEKAEVLKSYDKNNLLEYAKKESLKKMKTIDDILESDSLGLLDKDNDYIFDLKNVPKTKEMPNIIASRRPCKDFNKFEHLFKQCHLDLSSGKRKLRPFKKEQQISKGNFFILKGIMVYVANKGAMERVKNKINARLKCVFENGTEADMLLRSLAARLYENGRRITEHEENMVLESFNTIDSHDKETGFLYIVKSNSDKEEIRSIKNLYKIGFSTIPVEKRIKNSENNPTYLMSKVSIVSEFKCYNMNSQKLELLLHRFFSKSCLDIKIKDSQDRSHSPREWFVVPLPVIEEAIHLLLEGSIVNHEYDIENETIIRKLNR